MTVMWKKNLTVILLLTILYPLACKPFASEEDITIDGVQISPFRTFESWGRRQGGAIYKEILVSVDAMDRGGIPNGYIYDVASGTKICNLNFSFSINGKDYYPPHGNQVSFSNKFYDSESDFPLLYISQVNGGNGNNDIRGERGVLVYNLKKLTDNSYEPELVQAIIPNLNDSTLMSKMGNYTPNYIIDTDKGQLVVIGYPNKSWYDLSGPQPITIFDLPDITEGQEIVLTSESVVDYYTLPVTIALQQSFYCDGKIFSSGGNRGYASIRVINLSQKGVEYYYDMTSLTSGEPQFLGLWEGRVLYYEYDQYGIVYELTIPGYVFSNNGIQVSIKGNPAREMMNKRKVYDLNGKISFRNDKGIKVVSEFEDIKKIFINLLSPKYQ